MKKVKEFFIKLWKKIKNSKKLQIILIAVLAAIVGIAIVIGVTGKNNHSNDVISSEETSSEEESSSVEEEDEEKTPSEGLKYTLSDDDTYYSLTGIGTCKDKDIVIPSTYNGLPVTSIGYYAFKNCTRLTSVTIPDSVTSIGWGAFSSCDSLQYNEYDNAKYLGNENNPYHALIIPPTDDISSCIIHEDTKIIYAYAFSGCDKLKNVTIGNGVTSIGVGAFHGCDSLTSIDIPDHVTSIGWGTFYGCESLTSIDIPDSVTSIGNFAFGWCTSLTSIEIPDSVTSIGEHAFYHCDSLTSVTIPDGVKSIGEYAFYNCTSLQYNEYDNAKYLGNESNPYFALIETTSDDISSCTIHEDTKIIYGGAFSSCDSLTSAILPGIAIKHIPTKNLQEVTITSGDIGSSAFSGCDKLTSVTIGNGVTSIGYEAFRGCDGLTSIDIPDSVTSIGDSAFYYCDGLTSIDIPDSVTSIGRKAFEYCTNLTSVTIGNGVTSIGYEAFRGCYRLVEVYNKSSLNIVTGSSNYDFERYHAKNVYTEEGGSKLTTDENGFIIYDGNCLVHYIGEETEITIPDCITTINDYALYKLDNLTKVVIPDSVTWINDSAFYGCDSLTSVTIPDSVTSIGYYAFSGCSSLIKVNYTGTIDQWVEITFGDVSSNPLYYAKNLYINDELVTDVELTTATKISNYAFLNCSSLTSITIPDSVTSIGYEAFSYCSSLTSIEIPDSVTRIGSSAFYYCSSLTSIEIPDSVTRIGSSAFYYCDSLTSITFEGTMEEWNSMGYDDWYNVPATEVVCSDGTVTL